MDGLDIVALFNGQGSPQQEFGHPEHTVHGRADFVADLGQKLGFGVHFSITGGQIAANAELIFGDAVMAFA